MNLYIESSKVLHKVLEKKGSVKSLVYQSGYENKKQILGLVCETLKYSSVLQQLVDATSLLTKEHLLKKDKFLAQTLVHDFVVRGNLVKAGRLKQIITRNKSALKEQYENLLAEAGVESIEHLLPEHESDSLPRYVRVNLLKATVDGVIKTLEVDGWEQAPVPLKDSEGFIDAVQNLEEFQFLQDPHLFDLLVFPAGTDFHDNQLLTSGTIILQDKASCFPAHVLSPPEGAMVIDSCAAPGMKTSHIASLINNNGTVIAFDKDGRRLANLQRLTSMAGVTCVTAKCQDFLRVSPTDQCYCDVEYMLVDPSCSGSGIVSRMNQITDDHTSSSTNRLESLSNFQVTLLKHAMSFPRLKRVVYSTCSVHAEENEEVISEVAFVMKDHFKVSKVFPDWPERGLPGYEHSDCFLRMSPKKALSNGFFVACFERIEAEENFTSSKKSKMETSDFVATTLDDNDVQIKKKKKRKHNDLQIGGNEIECKKTKVTEEDKSLCNDKCKKERKKSKKHNVKEEHHDIENCNETNHEAIRKHKKKKSHSDKDNYKVSSSENETDRKKKKHKRKKDNNDRRSVENEELLKTDLSLELLDTMETCKKKKKHEREIDNDGCCSVDDEAISETDLSSELLDTKETHRKKKKHKREKDSNGCCSVDDEAISKTDLFSKLLDTKETHKKKKKHKSRRDIDSNSSVNDETALETDLSSESLDTTETHKKKKKHKDKKK